MSANYKEYPCDLCGAFDAVEVPYARLYTNNQPINICKKCGFVYVKLRRSAREIAKEWSDELYGNSYTARIPAVKARQVYVADFIDMHIGLKDKKLLDIGSGEGQFLQIVRNEYKADVFGIEPSPQNCVGMSEMGVECFEGTIEDALTSKLCVNAEVATIMWTLENCRSCRDMLTGAYELLKHDGYLVVATGSRILVPFKKRLRDYLGPNPVDTHAFRFSANTLRGILAVCGFEVVHMNRYLDTDYLCVIAQKRPKDVEISWEGDDFVQVYNFFERWHQESIFYG